MVDTLLKPDFSGYATKADLRCSDGRTITENAFQHMFKDSTTVKVPLVWHHIHNEPGNVLGHAILEYRDSSHADGAGIYASGYFNESEPAKLTKEAVRHGDVTAMSIFANNLIEKTKSVLHGVIREVSLVLSGANPGALIDNVSISHSEYGGEDEVLEDQAIIHTGLSIEVPDESDSTTEEVVVEDTKEGDDAAAVAGEDADLEHAAADATVQDIYDSFTDDQKQIVHFMIGKALEGTDVKQSDAVTHSDADDKEADTTVVHSDTEGDLIHQEGSTTMGIKQNVFDQNGVTVDRTHALTHDQLVSIVEEAKKPGGSFKGAMLAHAVEYGVENLELLFPDAQAITTSPEWISRRMEWVTAVLNGTKHSPFAKVKTLVADITADEARAKGYIKGTQKKDEVFKLLRRTTGPATIYKKQKLDRDDMLDITDIDVVNWLKAEMRLMIEEELARAILVGDGRDDLKGDGTPNEDKVKDPAGSVDGIGIRSILNDDDLYAIKYPMAANTSPKDSVKGLVRARSKYRGSGKPTLFISDNALTDIMLEEDKFGRALYETEQALADKVRVKEIITVDLFDEYEGLVAIMVSLMDYTIGSNKGGELTSFEDFDIDFNQYKYLQETRLSGGLTKPFSAVVVTRAMGTLATVTAPSFNGTTNTITIPTTTGVDYTIADEVVTGDVVITAVTEVEAQPKLGYYLASNTTRSWTFTP